MLRQPYEPFNPQLLSIQELPKDAHVHTELFAGTILVFYDDNHVLCAQLTHLFDEIEPSGVPLEHAVLVPVGKYTYLMDARGLPTEQDKKASPGTYSSSIMQTRDSLSLLSCVKGLLFFLQPENDKGSSLNRDYDRPVYSERLQQAVDAASQILTEVKTYAHNIHDKRLLEPLTRLVAAIHDDLLVPAHLLHDDEAVISDTMIHTIESSNRQFFFFDLRLEYFHAKVLLHWYTVQTLYLLRSLPYDTSAVSAHYKIVGSDRDRAMMTLAHTYICDHEYAAETEKWQLFANDQVVYSVNRINPQGADDLIYQLEETYTTFSDEDHIFWLR